MNAPRTRSVPGALGVLIDGTELVRGLAVFGMHPVERLVRGLLDAELSLREVCVALPEDMPEPSLPASLVRVAHVRFEHARRTGIEHLETLLASGDPVLYVQADAIVDTRLLAHVGSAAEPLTFGGGEGAQRGVMARFDSGLRGNFRDSGRGVADAIQAAIAAGELGELAEDEFAGYITMLRRELAPYLFRLRHAAECHAAERFLFWSNYKGSTDFLTRYVYPPLVWAMVRPLARWRVHPNWVTAVDIVATFGAVPLFMAGAWLPALFLAYLMSILDSVDGKLARVTFTSSKLGEVLDHGLDIVHPPIWYLAWGYALAGGTTSARPYDAALGMLGLYVVDRVIAGIFKARFGRSIHGYTPFDERMRTFISRRNVNLAFFTVALGVDAIASPEGWPVATGCLYAIVVWQAFCLVFHLQRLMHFWGDVGAGGGMHSTR